MKSKHFCYCCSLLFLFYCNILFAQQNKSVSVNQFTGTPNVIIPLYTIHNGAVSVPINLVYSGTGVKVQDVEGSAGMNWYVMTGGLITRELRGLPDDCQKNLSGSTRLGWLYNNNGTNINNFAIANSSADVTYINNNFGDLSDTEPDIFQVAAPGLSCSLVFDNNHVIRTIPYQDLKVKYVADGTGAITDFYITNNQGITYWFSGIEQTTKTIWHGTFSFFNKQYQQFFGTSSVGGIKYFSSWSLNKITDPNGNAVTFEYTQPEPIPANDNYKCVSIDSISLYQGTANNTLSPVTQHAFASVYMPVSPYSISISNGHSSTTVLKIHSTIGARSHQPIIDTLTGYGKKVIFNYGGGAVGASGHIFLTSLTEVNDAGEPSTYSFSYTGLANNSGSYSIALPDSASNQIDYWGYYNASNATSLIPQLWVNPSASGLERYRLFNPGNASANYPYLLAGGDRSANPSVVTTGCLSQITYPNGGMTTLTFESNDFYDNTSGNVVQGGGVRIKQITDYDGLNTANNITRNYSYVDPTTGHSSGKPIALPVFAFTTTYTGATGATQWNMSTVRSTTNLSQEDNRIIYGYVKESQTGAGSTAAKFTTPATNWDLSASPDWAPTVTNVQCPGCTTYGLVTADRNTYPFPLNPNFDFERGLASSVVSYNDNSQEVGESNYSYTRSSSPTIITGLKFETNGNVTSYAKYNIYAGTEELLSQESKKVFDSPTLSQAQQLTTNYAYTSSYHKLMTQKQVIGSDGAVETSYIKYAKDYVVSLGADSTANGLYHLQNLNINVPIERYTQVTKNGSTSTISGTLTKFNTFNPTGSAYLYLPVQKLRLKSANSLTDFQPSGISGSTFTNDSRYMSVENDQAYDFGGGLLTADDNNKHVKTVITDHLSNKPVAVISNAAYNEIAYNDFNSDEPGVGFTKTNNTYNYTTSSRSGQYALSLEAGGVLSKTLNKNVLASNYIFSAWINSTNAGNITITLTNSSNQSSSYNLAYGNTSGNWTYYEIKIPVGNMSSTFTAQFQSSLAISIDDVLFYPEVAEVSSVAYDPVTFLKTAETKTNGLANYYSYDSFGRLHLVYDQTKQIIAKKTYVTAGAIQNFNNSYLYLGESSISPTTATSVAFNVGNLLNSAYSLDGLTVNWNFGDGNTATGITATHVYTTAGNYSPSVTLNSPFYGQRTLTGGKITVTNPAPPPPKTIPLYYYENAGSSKITSLQFYQGTTLVYSFSESDLLGGRTILQGNYSIKVAFSKLGTTFKSISYTDGNTLSGCFPSTTTSPTTISLDLTNSNSISFTVDTATCLN